VAILAFAQPRFETVDQHLVGRHGAMHAPEVGPGPRHGGISEIGIGSVFGAGEGLGWRIGDFGLRRGMAIMLGMRSRRCFLSRSVFRVFSGPIRRFIDMPRMFRMLCHPRRRKRDDGREGEPGGAPHAAAPSSGLTFTTRIMPACMW